MRIVHELFGYLNTIEHQPMRVQVWNAIAFASQRNTNGMTSGEFRYNGSTASAQSFNAHLVNLGFDTGYEYGVDSPLFTIGWGR